MGDETPLGELGGRLLGDVLVATSSSCFSFASRAAEASIAACIVTLIVASSASSLVIWTVADADRLRVGDAARPTAGGVLPAACMRCSTTASNCWRLSGNWADKCSQKAAESICAPSKSVTVPCAVGSPSPRRQPPAR